MSEVIRTFAARNVVELAMKDICDALKMGEAHG